MINYIKHKLEICRAVAFVTYKEWSAYRTHSLVSVFVGPVYFIVQYFIWTISSSVLSKEMMSDTPKLAEILIGSGFWRKF